MKKKTENLRTVMEHYELQGKLAAQAIGVSPSMVSRWMSGEKTLSARSKSIEPLAEYILSQRNALSTENRDWLRRRFAESGRSIRFDWSKADREEIKTAFINYIANDDSVLSRSGSREAAARSADFYSIGGMDELSLLLHRELGELPQKSVLSLYVTGDGAEMHDAFLDELAAALKQEIKLHIFLLPQTEPEGLVIENRGDSTLVRLPEQDMEGTEFMSRYRDILLSPKVSAAVYYERRLSALTQTTLIIPERLVLFVNDTGKSALPCISVVRSRDFVSEAALRAEESFSKLEPVIQPKAVATSRFVYGKLYEAYSTPCDEFLVLSDGLNPMFMSGNAFEAYLSRKSFSEADRKWRLERFYEKREAFEGMLKEGLPYKEHNRSRFALTDGFGKLPAVFGDELFDEDFTDPQLILDILDGYIRLLRTYRSFRIRFYDAYRGPEREYMVLHDRLGLLLKRREAGAERRIFSHSPLLMQSVKTSFTDYWKEMRYRSLSPDGEMDTIQDIEGMMAAIRRETGLDRPLI